MPDYQAKPLGTESAPAAWKLPDNLELLVKRCFAHYDGTGAGGAFLPTLRVRDDADRVVLEVPMDASVAAGSSVEASWAPFLRTIPAATPSGGGGVPSVATFYFSTSLGGVAQTVGAGATANLVWQNARLPSDGTITGPIIGNVFINYVGPCMCLEFLRVGWETGAYNKNATLGTQSRISQADAFSTENTSTLANPFSFDEDWVTDTRMNAHIDGDLLHAYVQNGDVVARNVDKAFLTIFRWPAPGYTGAIPRYPQ